MGDVFDQVHQEQQAASGDIFSQIHAEAQGGSEQTGVNTGKIQQDVSNVAQGFGEGALKTVRGTGELIRKAGNYISPGFGNKIIPPVGQQALQQIATPENTPQKVGSGLEDVMEFIAGDEALKGLSYVAKLKELAPIASMLQKYPRLAGALGVGIRQGAVGAGQTIAKGGTPNEAASSGVVSGVLAGGGEGVAQLLPSVAPALRASAEKDYGKFLNPTKESTKYQAGQVIPRLLEDRTIVTSGKALEEKAVAKTADIGQQINDAVAKVPATVTPSTKPVLNALDNYRQQFVVNGVPINESAVKTADSLKDTISQLGGNVSYQSLNRVRQILDKSVAEARGYMGKTLAEGSAVDAQREAANAIRSELAKASPEIAKLKGEYTFWSRVGDVISATNERRVGQQGGLGKVVGPLVGAGATAIGIASGGAQVGLETAAASSALLAANELFKSPLWKTTSAVLKNEMANALASGDASAIARVVTKVSAAYGASAQRSAPTAASQQ